MLLPPRPAASPEPGELLRARPHRHPLWGSVQQGTRSVERDRCLKIILTIRFPQVIFVEDLEVGGCLSTASARRDSGAATVTGE